MLNCFRLSQEQKVDWQIVACASNSAESNFLKSAMSLFKRSYWARRTDMLHGGLRVKVYA